MTTLTIMTTNEHPSPQSESLISVSLRNRLTRRVQADAHVDHDTAERIVGQTVAFLAACAANPGKHLVPSELVDHGWHAFLLHTCDYSEFCERVAGRFIHHRPTEPGETEPDGHSAIAATTDAICAVGLVIDEDLWPSAAKCDGNCSQCYAGCADDPRGATA